MKNTLAVHSELRNGLDPWWSTTPHMNQIWGGVIAYRWDSSQQSRT